VKSLLLGALAGALVVLTLGTVTAVLFFPKRSGDIPAAGGNNALTSPVAAKNPVEGTWFNERNPINPCSIVAGHPGLIVTDENGGFSRLVYDPAAFVIATDWRRGLRGEVQEDKIHWANGVVWVRAPHEPQR